MVRSSAAVIAGICAGPSSAAGRPGDSVRLNEAEVYELLDGCGIPHPAIAILPAGAGVEERREWARRAVELADEGGRLLLKVLGRDLLHKSDLGGVRILHAGADDPAGELGSAAADLVQGVGEKAGPERVEGVLACGFVPHHANQPGQELLISLRQDPAFGPVVVVGVGGVLTEWYGRGTRGESRLIFPAKGLDEAAVAEALAAHPLLSLATTPSRLYPSPPLDLETVARAVMQLAHLGLRHGADGDGEWTLEEIEINPAVASGGRLVALDGVGLVSRRRWPHVARPLEKIGALLAPRSAVVLGASSKGANPGRIILNNLLYSDGIDRDQLFVVHHREREIAGVPCLPEVAALPRKVDLAVIAIPADGARDAIAALVAGDLAQAIILIPGGFAETGETDLSRAIERTLTEGHARPGGGPVMVGPNCLGIVSRHQYNTFFLPPYKLPFRPGLGENLAIVSQSGAYLVTFASNYDGIIQPRASISFGNQMDLTVADFLSHFTSEPAVDVVACYIEGFRPGDGVRFLEHARQARARGKRVVVFKAGKTELGAKAAASHTASLAGDYDVARSCLERAGVTVAETLDEFEDLIKTFTLLAGKRLTGRRVGIMSNAGFECSAVMDRLGGLELARFSDETRGVLDRCLPSYAHRDNPVDATPIADDTAYAACCRAILDCPEVDVALISAVPATPALNNLVRDPHGRHPEDLDLPTSFPRQLIPILQASAKPAALVVDSGAIYDVCRESFEKAGIPVFRKIDRAAHALSACCGVR